MFKKFLFATSVGIMSFGCIGVVTAEAPKASSPTTEMQTLNKDEPIRKAVARIYSCENGKEIGAAYFFEEDSNLKMTVEVNGLKEGEHGIHIHKYGDCSRKAEAAGPHYDMQGNPHGAPTDPKKHGGDLGNIKANKDGKAQLETSLSGENLHFLIGRSLVIHENKDDLRSQPSGNSGARIACGVIGLTEENKVSTPSKSNTINPDRILTSYRKVN